MDEEEQLLATPQARGSFEPGLVLIADDEEPLAETVAFVVREAGYTPLIALHGREALELARARRPALIIIDVMLPYLNGPAVIEALRASSAGAMPPTILMTGTTLVEAHAAGADVVLRKPFHLADLERLLHRYLASDAPAAT